MVSSISWYLPIFLVLSKWYVVIRFRSFINLPTPNIKEKSIKRKLLSGKRKMNQLQFPQESVYYNPVFAKPFSLYEFTSPRPKQIDARNVIQQFRYASHAKFLFLDENYWARILKLPDNSGILSQHFPTQLSTRQANGW